MNRKSVYSLILAVALAVSFAFPVFADDLATASDADYYSNQLLSVETSIVKAAASELSPLYSVNAQNQWTQLPYDNSLNYVWVPSDCTRLCWIAPSGTRHLRLRVDSSDLGKFGLVVYYPDDADGSSSSVWDYFSNYLDDDGIFYMGNFNPKSSPVYFFVNTSSSFMIGVNQYVDSSLSLDISGIYDNSDVKFKLKTVKIDGVSLYPKSFARTSNRWLNYFFTGGGILKKGYEYSFTFYNSFGPSCLSGLHLQTNLTDICKGVSDGNYVTFTFTPTRDLNTSDLVFYVDKGIGNENLQGVFYYVSSSSSYIPASDTGQQGQTTAANTTIIKNVVTNISNTVSNISNQITTSTTTITNAVNNVANQVTGSINSQTNTLSDKIQGQTNTITDNQNQNTDKVIKNQDENTDKVVKNQDENTDKLTKNQDENTNKVTEKLEDVKTGIISGIIEGLKNLFIPSEDFFKSYFDDLYSWFGERLGFLSFPIDLLAELAEMFLGSSSTDCILTLPSFSISGFKLWEESSFNLTSFLNENFKFVLDAIKLGTSVILVFNFIHLCERKWEEVMMN